jgi:hypothetical protein
VRRLWIIDLTDEFCCVFLSVGARINISRWKSSHQNGADSFVVWDWTMQWMMEAMVL